MFDLGILQIQSFIFLPGRDIRLKKTTPCCKCFLPKGVEEMAPFFLYFYSHWGSREVYKTGCGRIIPISYILYYII